MESLQSSFISSFSQFHNHKPNQKSKPISIPTKIRSSVTPDPWTLSDGLDKPKPRSKNPKNPLSDDNARRIINAKARYLSALRRNQGPRAQTPKWIKRTPEQMVQYLHDDRNGHLYGKHVVAAIQAVRSLSQKPQGSYDMRRVLGSFVAKLTFREMCVVLKEQKGWRQVHDFFAWMKLQLCYYPSVIAYTIVLRAYGQAGKIKLAEETFLEMLEAGCEPDELACGTMLCTYARWGRHKAMLAFYSAVKERGVLLSVAVYNFMLSSLQKKSLHQDVIQIYTDMSENRVVANHFTFTVVICSLVKQGQIEDALTAFNRMKSIGFVPEEVTYSLLIISNVKKGDQEEAIRLYEDMRSLHIVPSNFTCASLLNLYYKNGDYSKALSLFSEMERCKIQADEVIYGLLVKIYGKLGLFDDAENTFDEAQRLGPLRDEKTYLAMAQVFIIRGEIAKALHTMDMMRSRNVPFSRFGYTILLKCYLMQEDLRSAEATFKIRKGNVVFDEELCRMVMKVYSNEGMLREAEQFIEEIKASGSMGNSHFVRTIITILNAGGGQPEKEKVSLVAPSVLDTRALELMLCLYLASGNEIKAGHTLRLLLEAADGLSIANQLVGKLIHKGDASRAEVLLDLLIKRDARPSVSILSSMIKFYGKEQKLHSAKQLFAAVTSSAVCSEELYNAVIDACVKCGEPGEAYQYYKESIERGVNLTPVAISVLVNSLTNNGMHRETEDVIHRSFGDNSQLDTVAYNTFIKAMLEAGKLHFAANIYERMLSAGASPSIQTYSTMISVYGRQRKYDEAVKIFNVAQSSGILLDEKVYTNMISLYGKAGMFEEASALFSEMPKKGIRPGKISYNVMMNAYAAAGHYTKAEELFETMRKDGCLPDSLTYLALMRAYTEGLKCQEAEAILILMQKEKLQPSCAHLNLLVSAYAKAGLIDDASRIFESLVSCGLQPDLVCYRTLLRSYLDYGYVNKGIALFERIREHMEPDRFILSAAVQLYECTGRDIETEGVIESMNTMGIPLLRGLEVGAKIKS